MKVSSVPFLFLQSFSIGYSQMSMLTEDAALYYWYGIVHHPDKYKMFIGFVENLVKKLVIRLRVEPFLLTFEKVIFWKSNLSGREPFSYCEFPKS